MRDKQRFIVGEYSIGIIRQFVVLVICLLMTASSVLILHEDAYAASSQEELLNNYFDAVNKLDVDGVASLTGIMNTG